MDVRVRPGPPPHEIRTPPPRFRGGPGPALLFGAALLTAGPAAIHFAVAPMHFQEYVPFGVFFVAAGALQLAAAAAMLLRPSRRLFLASGAGTIGVIALYLLSRTAGVPVGPHPGRPEMVGIPDVTCTAMELVSLPLFALAAFRRPRPRRRHPVRIVLAAAPATLLAAALTYVGTGTAAAGMPVAYSVAPMVPGQPSTSVDLLTAPPGDEPVRTFTLTARVARIDGQDAWTYGGTVPGPELRVTQGDRLRVTLVNHLPASTTIHWHGVPGLPNAEDGVAGITQQAVPPGHSMTYEFVVNDPGTYWYHSHQDTSSQITRGLFGALVVEPKSGPTEDRDYTVVLHDALGGGVAANGQSDLRLAARPGERVRLRLVNAVAPGMDGTPEAPVLFGAPYRVVALDGRDLDQPQELGPRRIQIGMGQRADLIFTMPASGAVRLVDTESQAHSSGVQSAIATIAGSSRLPVVTVGDGPPPAAPSPAALPAFDPLQYGVPASDPVAAARPDASYPIVLTEGPGFHGGSVQLVHEINGQASPNVPPIVVHEGEVVRLHIVNDTPEYHPMHLHGHTMSVLDRDGRPASGSPVRVDTVLVGPHETMDVAFLADNPGLWMFHCHVLLHAAFGLTMSIDYAGISTPYEMGTRSGNMPE
jgi:FtsP/CotA-like multicopper oxidase with cupredoxin domain